MKKASWVKKNTCRGRFGRKNSIGLKNAGGAGGSYSSFICAAIMAPGSQLLRSI